jgi:hypothetical protein
LPLRGACCVPDSANVGLLIHAKYLMEKIAKILENSPIARIWVRLNQSVTIFALLIALAALYVAYTKYNEDKVKADEDRVAKAWDTLTRISGKGGNGGQITAIQILVNSHVRLDRVDLRNTYLAGAQMKGAFLRGADLSGANLSNANLQGTDFSGANLKGAVLVNSNLGGAMFDEANLDGAVLSFSKLDIAVVLSKSMKGTDITGARFVLEGEDGQSDFSMFGDTIAENWRADERQRRINETCSDKKWNEPQDKLLPVKIVNNPCARKINYQNIRNKVYEFSE